MEFNSPKLASKTKYIFASIPRELAPRSLIYENEHKNDAETLYKKVIEVFSGHGPDQEYEFMLYALKKVANAGKAKDGEEQKVIANFSYDLLERFKKDIEKIKEKYT